MGSFFLSVQWLGVVTFVMPPGAWYLVRLMLASYRQSGFGLIHSGLSLAALVWFETICAVPSLVASFRIGRCRPVVGGVCLINCFPDMW